MLGMALELSHAGRTGQFPFPGALRDQPWRLQFAFRVWLTFLAVMDRASANMLTRGKPKRPSPGDNDWRAACQRHGLKFLEALKKLETARRAGESAEDEFWEWFLGD